MLGWTTTVAAAAAVLAIPLLVVTGTSSLLTGRADGRPRARLGTDARRLLRLTASVLVVAGVAGVGFVAASHSQAWSALHPLALGTAACVLLLARGDLRLWTATAVLLVPAVLVATVLARALGHVYVADPGTWGGARLLVGWLGAAGNPVDPAHGDAVTAFVTLGTGLPYAVALAAAWRATRPSVRRLERVALLCAVVACGTSVVGTGVTALAVVVGGARLGVPLGLLVVALLAALVLVLPVATAAGATLVTLLPWVRELPDLLRLEPQEDLDERRRLPADGSLRSLGSFVTGHAPWARHLFVVSAVLGVLGLTVLSLGQRAVVGDPHAHEVDYVRVSDVTPLPARAVSAFAAPGGATWVLTRDHRLVALDPRTGAYGAASVPAAVVAPLPKAAGALVVTPGSLPQLLLVTDLGKPVPVTGFGRGTTVSVTAGTTSYAVDSAGTAAVLDDRHRLVRVVHLGPTDVVTIRGGDVWTLARTGTPASGEQWTAVRHRPNDLREVGRVPATRTGSVVAWGDTAPLRWDLGLGRFVDAAAADRGWLTTTGGAVEQALGASRTTYRLPYDRVAGVVGHGGTTWAVVDDDGSAPVHATPRSYVVRWADPLTTP
ncbi:hypothetical protein [Lapillicoccus jejuensis]|uniref:Uncharacterized protein n=1 Tax=Lapillicoccus jejuensis TaxID=402171 RepID=A0A542DXP9_9MICO|nr:hypothetical protein [Lapillicoccus jejuensis]TQJ07857.1 hypothetical protein FB458_0928 [Lapillicoccus jejuensis]